MIVRAKRQAPDLVEIGIQEDKGEIVNGKLRMSQEQSEKLREYSYRHRVSQQAIIETAVRNFIELYD